MWPCPSFFWYDTDFSEFDSADVIDDILEMSVSCKKKDGGGHTCPSFFWYDNDKDLTVYFLKTCVKYCGVTSSQMANESEPLALAKKEKKGLPDSEFYLHIIEIFLKL